MFSVEEVLRRLQTFSFENWTIKYKQLNPYTCACHGFVSIGENQIECELCKEKIHVTDPYEDSYSYENAMKVVEHYKTLFKTCHVKDCFYYNPIQPISINKEYFFTEWKTYYTENLNSYIDLDKIQLPVLAPRIKEYIGERTLNILFKKKSLTDPTIVNVPSVLAIFGWKYRDPATSAAIIAEGETPKPYLKCAFCARKIIISEFATTTGETQNLDDETLIAEESKSNYFDPLEEHRHFCKWGKSTSLARGKQYGWSICLEMLRYNEINGKEIGSSAPRLERINSEEPSINENVLAEQTKYKLEIVGKLQELRNIKDRTMKKAEDVQKLSMELNVKDSEKFAEVLKRQKYKLEDIIQELNLKVDPSKKVKGNDTQ